MPDYAAEGFISYLMENNTPRIDPLNMPFPALKAAMRDALEKVMPGIALSADTSPSIEEDVTLPEGIRRLRVTFTSEPGLRCPAYVLLPKGADGDTPCVVAAHGHGYGVRDIVGLMPDGAERSDDPGYHKDFGLALCRAGMAVIAPELYGFGDMRSTDDIAKDEYSSCYDFSSRLIMMGKNMPAVRARQACASIDALKQLNLGVDTARMGIMGISGGGLTAAFAAACDERFRVAVISGYVNTFAGCVMSLHHCVDNYIPGFMLDTEMPAMIASLCPRPLLIEAGDEDDIFPLQYVREAYGIIERVYAAQGAETPVLDVFPGGHQIHGVMAYPFLKAHL